MLGRGNSYPGKPQARGLSDFVKGALIIQIAIWIVLIGFNYYGSRLEGAYLLDRLNLVLGRDFFNIWHYGVAAWMDNPGAFYDTAAYGERLDALIPNYDSQKFSYPPHLMLLIAPFGLLGYNAALAVFTLFGAGCLYASLRGEFDAADESRLLRAGFWLMPCLLLALICGQLSLLLAAILITIFRQMDKRPWLAGLLIALLTVKPQIGFLFPVFLLLTGRWRVFAYASLFTILFIGASIVIHGLEPWEMFIGTRVGEQMELLIYSHPLTRAMMPSVAANIGIVTGESPWVMIIHLGVAALALLSLIWGIRTTQDTRLQYGLFIAVSFVITPYLMVYDTVVLGWVILMLLQSRHDDQFGRLAYKLFIWVVPLGLVLSMSNLPGTALILLAIWLWIVRLCWREKPSLASGSAIA